MAASAEQLQLLDAALEPFARPDTRRAYYGAVHTPALIHAALAGDERPAWPLAAALALVDLGIRLLDALADGDLDLRWAPFRPGEIELVGIGLACVWPQLAIQELAAPCELRLAMARRLGQGLALVAAGQQLDLRQRGEAAVDPDGAERAAVGKTGERRATYAALGAMLAGASEERVQLCAGLGRALGTAAQIASDCHDLLVADDSRDLANGTRTFPIALELGQLTPLPRAELLERLDRAVQDAGIRAAVRARLREGGLVRRCALVVETYCQRAQRLLDELDALEPARTGLARMIADVSMFAA
jgi:heptaprenyl diphosphate synthase